MYYYKKLQYQPLKVLKQWKGKKIGTVSYYEPCFYDSETSKDTFTEVGVEHVIDTWVYLWACSVGSKVYYGRCITDFREFLKKLLEMYETDDHHIMTIYVHNLPYDVSYFWFILFELDPDLKVLALSPNKPFVIYCYKVGLVFKCSYRLANRSLDKWGKDLGIKARKKVGMIDYSERHTPNDALQTEQYIYMYYDVAALKECFYKECELSKYNFVTIPLTSTGFVRKIFQKAYKQNLKKNKPKFLKTQINKEQYLRLLRASMGGMTEVGRHVIGRTVTGKIRHRDFDSHYPTQQVVNTFPMRPVTIIDKDQGINANKTILRSKIEWYIKHNYWLVMDVIIKDLHIKQGVTAPFMMRSKVIPESSGVDILHINGKIISINYGCVRTCFTSDDYEIFKEQYDFKMCVLAMDAYELAPLPSYVLDTVKYYYQQKNELKSKYKRTGDESDRLNLMLCKGRLNGIFGCSYTRPVRNDIAIDTNYTWHTEHKDIEQELEKFYSNINNCLSFAWGVRVTSSARKQLHAAILKIGYKYFLYCDTDSAFYIETPENKKALDAWNDELQQKSKDNGYFVEYDGKKKYFNYFDDENENIVAFRALHAKCYGYITDDGQLHITVAGVPRKTGDTTREQELNTLDNLSNGFVFRENGGTRAEYYMHPLTMYGDIPTAGGCAILDTTKELHEVYCNEQPLTMWELTDNIEEV